MSNHLRDDASTHQISMGRRSLVILHLKGFGSLFTWVQKKRDSDLLFMLKVNFSAPLRYFGYFYEYFYYQYFSNSSRISSQWNRIFFRETVHKHYISLDERLPRPFKWPITQPLFFIQFWGVKYPLLRCCSLKPQIYFKIYPPHKIIRRDSEIFSPMK